MKKIILLSLASLVLVACQGEKVTSESTSQEPATSQGDTTSQAAASNQGVIDENQAFNHRVYEAFSQHDLVNMTLTSQLEWQGKVHESQQVSQERINEGSLVEYWVRSTTSTSIEPREVQEVAERPGLNNATGPIQFDPLPEEGRIPIGETGEDGEEASQVAQEQDLSGAATPEVRDGKVETASLTEDYYFQDGRTYRRMNEGAWVAEDIPGQPGLYFSFIRLLLEDSGAMTTEARDNQVYVTKTIADEANLKQILPLLNVPLVVTDQAQVVAQIDYHLDGTSFDIQSAEVNLEITDYNQTYQVTLQAQPSYEDQDAPFQVDLEGEIPQASDSIEGFLQANPLEVYNYYETNLSYGEGDETLFLHNKIAGQDHIGFQTEISEGQVAYAYPYFQGMRLAREEDQLRVVEGDLVDYYDYYVTRYLENHKDLEALPANEELAYDNYRLVFENLEDLEALGADLDLSGLAKEEGFYGIDFLVHKTTKQLLGVYLWSIGPDQETIEDLVILHFTGFNNRWNNAVSQEVPQEAWEALFNQDQALTIEAPEPGPTESEEASTSEEEVEEDQTTEAEEVEEDSDN